MLGLQRPSVALLATSAALAAGCGSGGDRLDVFAAASLAAVMGDLEPVFEAEHRDVDVVVNLAGSSTLAAQILAGADPMSAVKYQILVMFLIAGGTCLGALAAVYGGAWRLTDARHRLRLDRLAPVKGR